jgi:hypothetical protein
MSVVRPLVAALPHNGIGKCQQNRAFSVSHLDFGPAV